MAAVLDQAVLDQFLAAMLERATQGARGVDDAHGKLEHAIQLVAAHAGTAQEFMRAATCEVMQPGKPTLVPSASDR
jgi:hypothetical protein